MADIIDFRIARAAAHDGGPAAADMATVDDALEELDAFARRLETLAVTLAINGPWRERCAELGPGVGFEYTDIELRETGDVQIESLLEVHRSVRRGFAELGRRYDTAMRLQLRQAQRSDAGEPTTSD